MEIAEPTSRASRKEALRLQSGAAARAEAHDGAPMSIRDVFKGSRERGFFARVFDYLVRLNGSPEAIAWGLALGLFVAMTPSVGFQTVIVLPIAGMLRVNKAAAALGVWLTNPLTIPFFYGLTYWVGASILGYRVEQSFESQMTWRGLLEAGPHVVLALILGGVILGGVFALASYLPVLYMIRGARATARAAARSRQRRRERKVRERSSGDEP